MDVIARHPLVLGGADCRVLFNIRLKTQIAQNDMAASLAKLIALNDQNSLFGAFRVFNPLFHINQYIAQRSPLTPTFAHCI